MFRWRPIVLGCAVPLLSSVAAPAYGVIDDTAVHVPPFYDSFVPPALGGSYADTVFGVTIKRVSDALSMPNNAGTGQLAFIGTEFSTASPFNSANSRLILVHQSYFGLYDGSGSYIQDLPFAVHASSEPRWSRTDPDVLYYVSSNALMRLDLGTGAPSLVHSFGEYAAISGRGESDISRDGDHFVFAGDNRYVFVYTIGTDTKGPVLDTIGHSFDNLYIAPDNSVAIGWLPTGTARFTGVELFDRNLVFQRQLTHAIGHMRLTRDTNGDDVLVWTNSNDPLPIANCANGLVKVRLSNAQQTCLLQLDWSLAVHITAADGNGWAFAETYAPADPLPAPPGWKPYTNEILQVKLDGTETRRLLHHRSRPVNSYGYQPRTTVSRDGSKLVFTSNYNLQAILGHPIEYTDAYFVAVPAMPAPYLSIDNATVTEGNAGTVTAGFSVTLSPASAGTVTVDYQTTNVTAFAGSDYVGVSGQLTFAPGQTSRPVSVTVNGDLLHEADESFVVNLSNAAGAAIVDAQGVGTISNDDAPPSLSIGDVTVVEGNSGTTAALFSVSVSVPSGLPISVHYTTSDSNATAGSDYTAATATLPIPAGALSASFPISVLGDTADEPNEAFLVTLSSPVNATLDDATGQGTILDDDGRPALCRPIAQAPFTIAVPGGYCLVQSVAYAPGLGAAIVIDSDDVQLDLKGFTIDGSAAGSATLAYGIYALDRSDVRIRNGTILGFLVGAFLDDDSGLGQNSSGNSLKGLRVDGNKGAGLWVEGKWSIVRDNLVVDTGGSTATGPNADAWGIFARGAQARVLNNDVVRVDATGSGMARGIHVSSASGSTVERNRIGNAMAASNQAALLIGSSSNVLAVQNRLHGMSSGIVFTGSTGKYRGNLSTGVVTPFTGGTNAGNNQ